MKQIELWMDQERPDCLSHIVINGRRSSNPRLCAHMLHRPMQEWIPAVTTKHKVWHGLIGELSGVLNSLHFSVRFVGVAEMYEKFLRMVTVQESSGIVAELEYAPYRNNVAGNQFTGTANGGDSINPPQQSLEIPVVLRKVPGGTGLSAYIPEWESDPQKADGISGLVADMQNLSENAIDRYLKKRLRIIARSLGSENIYIYLNILYDTQDVAKLIMHMGIPRLFLNVAQDELLSMPAVLGSGNDIAQTVARVCQLHSLPFDKIMVLVVQSNPETFDGIVRSLCQDSPGVHAFRLMGDGEQDTETLNGMSVTYLSYLKKNLAQFIRSCPKDVWADVTATEAVLRRLFRGRENGAE